ALMTNVATVTATEPEINPDNNSVTAVSMVRGFVDIVMGSTVAPNPVLVSSNVTYSIFVTNKGPAAATSLVVTNVLPSAVSFLSGSTSQGTVDNLGNLVTFTLGTLASNATATMTISGVTTA